MMYGYEQPIQLPTLDLYDKLIMAMALNAAKDMYDRNELNLKEFYKTYGDFMSPIAADQEWWDQNMEGAARRLVNDIYARGGDPLRNRADMALLLLFVNSRPYAEAAFKKLCAKNAEEYYKNMAVLKANNKYDKDFSEFLKEDPNQWASNYAGTTSPTQFLTLKEATNEWYNDRTPRDLTPEEKKQLGLDPRYSYTGYFDSDLMNVAKGNTPGWLGTPQAAYFRELAKRQVLARGDEATQDNIEAQLLRNIANALQEWLVGPTQGKVDEFILDDYKTLNQIRADRERYKNEYLYKTKYEQEKNNSEEGTKTDVGYSTVEDVYLTSLAKAAGIEYLPKDGVDPNDLTSILREATKNQNAAIKNTGSVLAATGMFLSPQKIAGLILSDGKNGYGYFLNPGYFKNLHALEDVRSSYKNWRIKGITNEDSKLTREEYKQLSKDIITTARETLSKLRKKGEFRLKVVPTADENGNNVYGMVGDDNRWHTYVRVKVYLSNGKTTVFAGEKKEYEKTDEMGIRVVNENRKKQSDKLYETEKRYTIPQEGIDMVLEVGLHSNEGKASPDMSVSAREDLGFYGYDATKARLGKEGNKDWPYGNNVLTYPRKPSVSLQ